MIQDQDLNVLGSPLISLKDLPKFNEFDRVTVRITAIKIQEPRTVSNSKVKQEIMGVLHQLQEYNSTTTKATCDKL